MIWTTQPRSDVGALRAIVKGDGPPVLLIHGVGLRAEAWTAQVDALAAQYKVVAVDMPGHGESPRLAEIAELSDYTDTIASCLKVPTLVIGHSMGAMIALDLALRHPHLVRAVAALNAVFQRSSAAAAAVKARAQRLDGVTMADPSDTLIRWFGDAPSPEREACATWLTGTDPAGYRLAYSLFAREDGPAASALAGLASPALFLTGGEEPNSTPEMSRNMANIAPQGRAQIVEGAAHMMPMTHAAEVNAALLDFAQEVWS